MTYTDQCHRGHPWPESRRRHLRGWRCWECVRIRKREGPQVPDDGAVARAVSGDPPAYLQPEERRRVVLELRSARDRVSLAETARRARCTVRQVCRIQKEGRGDKW